MGNVFNWSGIRLFFIPILGRVLAKLRAELFIDKIFLQIWRLLQLVERYPSSVYGPSAWI